MAERRRASEESLAEINGRLTALGKSPRDFGLNLDATWPFIAKQWDKFAECVEKTRCPSVVAMNKIGIYDDVRYLFAQSSMDRFLDKLIPENEELKTDEKYTLEFLSSVVVNKLAAETPLSITFSLGGVERQMTTAQVNEVFGTPEDRYGSLLIKHRNYNDQEFWYSITHDLRNTVTPYEPKKAKVTSIRNPVLRYTEKILMNTIFGRTESGSVPIDELYCLWCLLNGVKFNCAAYFLLQVERIQRRSSGGVVRFGGLISIIAESFGLEVEGNMDGSDMDENYL